MTIAQSAKAFLKSSLIQAGLEATALPPLRNLWPAAAGRGVIFTLHHVRLEGDHVAGPNAHLSVTPEFLDEAIEAALECGLTPVTLEDLPARLADKADERKFVAFTLDDGYRNNAEFAAPVFRKHAVPYTIFITEGFVERTRSLWWETAERLTRLERAISFRGETLPLGSDAERRAAFNRIAAFVQTEDEDKAVAMLDETARAHGIEPLAITAELTMDADELRALAADPFAHFGAHTVTHVNLRRVDAGRLETELRRSADAVERYLGRRPRAFAYPYGFAAAVSEREFRAAADAGFTAAVTTLPGVLSARNAERPTAFHRVSLNGRYQKRRYVKALISGLPFRLM